MESDFSGLAVFGSLISHKSVQVLIRTGLLRLILVRFYVHDHRTSVSRGTRAAFLKTPLSIQPITRSAARVPRLEQSSRHCSGKAFSSCATAL